MESWAGGDFMIDGILAKNLAARSNEKQLKAQFVTFSTHFRASDFSKKEMSEKK
jgi:hypothetical protein